MYHIRNCNKSIVTDDTLTADGEHKQVPKINGRPCLYNHIGQCDKACQGYISKADYRENINKAIKFLEGNYKDTIKCLDSLKKVMYQNLSIIVVDNNSKDDSFEILKEYEDDIEK